MPVFPVVDGSNFSVFQIRRTPLFPVLVQDQMPIEAFPEGFFFFSDPSPFFLLGHTFYLKRTQHNEVHSLSVSDTRSGLPGCTFDESGPFDSEASGPLLPSAIIFSAEGG